MIIFLYLLIWFICCQVQLQ